MNHKKTTTLKGGGFLMKEYGMSLTGVLLF
jgi:hypothetical protein